MSLANTLSFSIDYMLNGKSGTRRVNLPFGRMRDKVNTRTPTTSGSKAHRTIEPKSNEQRVDNQSGE